MISNIDMIVFHGSDLLSLVVVHLNAVFDEFIEALHEHEFGENELLDDVLLIAHLVFEFWGVWVENVFDMGVLVFQDLLEDLCSGGLVEQILVESVEHCDGVLLEFVEVHFSGRGHEHLHIVGLQLVYWIEEHNLVWNVYQQNVFIPNQHTDLVRFVLRIHAESVVQTELL